MNQPPATSAISNAAANATGTAQRGLAAAGLGCCRTGRKAAQARLKVGRKLAGQTDERVVGAKLAGVARIGQQPLVQLFPLGVARRRCR